MHLTTDTKNRIMTAKVAGSALREIQIRRGLALLGLDLDELLRRAERCYSGRAAARRSETVGLPEAGA